MEAEQETIRYSITTYLPQSHIQICSIIGTTGIHVLDAEIGNEDFYGRITVEGTRDLYEHMLMVPNVTLEILEDTI